jgi:20S proteasome alpha/beta subunit
MRKKYSKEIKTKKIRLFPEIKFPKEVEFLRELNKFREEEYKKWLRKKETTEKLLGKSTLIIGVRAKDGIVLGSDRKIVRGGESEFTEKIRDLKIKENSPLIFASAGYIGVIEDFLEVFEETLIQQSNEGKINSLLAIKWLAEDLVANFETRYAPKLEGTPLEFIFGGLSKLDSGKARLYTIMSRGFGERINSYHIIGHGSPYTQTIAKYLFPVQENGKINLTCNEILPRIATCIYWIGEEIDYLVGGKPQIVYILDEEGKINEGKYDEDLIEGRVKEFKKSLKEADFKRG